MKKEEIDFSLYDSDEIASLFEFIQLVCCDGYNTKFNEGALFRGQKSSRFKLMPKIGRQRSRNGTLKNNEKSIFRDFKNTSKPFIKNEISTIDYLCMGQHWGLPTRLLDWSNNPLVALWFAVSDICDDDADYGVVWVLEFDEDDLIEKQITESKGEEVFDLTSTKIFVPKHLDTRIVSQSGIFTVHKFNEEAAMFEPLDESKKFKDKIHPILINPLSFSDVRYDLDTIGINNYSIFRDLHGLCKQIEWKNIHLEDEES